MMHRDRAWRRKKTRLSTIHADFVDEIRSHPNTTTQSIRSDRPHQHGKLTQSQAMRLDGQLRTDIQDAWAPEFTIPMENPPNQTGGNPPT